MGPAALMMSAQAVNMGRISAAMIAKRDTKYNISSEEMARSRLEIPEAEWINPQADYWKQHGKGFAVDITSTEMNKTLPFP